MIRQRFMTVSLCVYTTLGVMDLNRIKRRSKHCASNWGFCLLPKWVKFSEREATRSDIGCCECCGLMHSSGSVFHRAAGADVVAVQLAVGLEVRRQQTAICQAVQPHVEVVRDEVVGAFRRIVVKLLLADAESEVAHALLDGVELIAALPIGVDRHSLVGLLVAAPVREGQGNDTGTWRADRDRVVEIRNRKKGNARRPTGAGRT